MINNIIRNLRKLLDDTFESSDVYEYPILARKIQKIIGGDIKILLCFREKPYFDLSNTDKELIFQYFSFYIDSDLRLYSTRSALVADIEKIRLNSFDVFQSKNCVVYMEIGKGTAGERKQIFNLLKRIVVFFYQNSGAKSQFLDSVSDRFIKEFWSLDKAQPVVFTYDFALEFICDRLKIDCCLYSIQDEFFNKHQSILDSLNFIKGNNKNIEYIVNNSVFNNDKVTRDIYKSIVRKNNSYGSLNDSNYCISTFTDDYVSFAGDQEIKSFKIRPEFICIYWATEKYISMDDIAIANTFFGSFFRNYDDFEETEFRDGLEAICGDVELRLSSSPVPTQNLLMNKFVSVIRHLFANSRALFGKCPMCLRLYQPSDQSLKQVYFTLDSEDESDVLDLVSIKDLSFASSMAFAADETVSVWHPSKIEDEKFKVRSYGKNKSAEYEWQVEHQGQFKNCVNRTDCSILAIPIRINQIVIGVLEYTSLTRRNLHVYSEVLERIGETCADIYRRIELSNDRGWLVRMHFLHAARHRIEQIVSEVQNVAPDQARNLNDLISSAVVDTEEEGTFDMISSGECIYELATRCNDLFEGSLSVDRSIELFSPLENFREISKRNFVLLSEFLEAMAANVRKHGFDGDGLRVFAGARSGESPVICISYHPKETWETLERMQRICISPLPNLLGSAKSFSYGLFLLATQIRMSGGWVVSHVCDPDHVGQVKFGFTAILNADEFNDELEILDE